MMLLRILQLLELLLFLLAKFRVQDSGFVLMKHIVKILSILVAVTAFWIGLLLTSVVPRISVRCGFCIHLTTFDACAFTNLHVFQLKLHSAFQLPVYLIMSLGCYGLLMVGIGLMRFTTCPQEAFLLLRDVVEAKDFLRQKGVDIGSD